MKFFVDSPVQPLLKANQLDSFDALWNLKLQPVDVPNTERGGYSEVARLELEGKAFYLKRQSNHLTRSLRHPFGEPTFAREMRNILRYQQLQIPALQAGYFAQRKVGDQQQAMLLTYALDGWQDLAHWQKNWSQLSIQQQQAIIDVCAQLVRKLHQAGQMHGCLYPKHIFLQQVKDNAFAAQLIDLEKTRRLWFGAKDRIKDLDALFRRSAKIWGQVELQRFLQTYLTKLEQMERWMTYLSQRRADKENRR